MKHRNIVRFLWAGLVLFALFHMVTNIVDYLGPDEFSHHAWKVKQILASTIAAAVILFNVIYVGRGGVYIKITIVLISVLFGLYGVIWLLMGGDGHVLWRIGFPVFLIILCVYTLIVQKRYAE